VSVDDPLSSQRLAAMRQAYRREGLDASELAPTWLDQLRLWLADAERGGIIEPNAMVLGTVGPDGAPSARTVLLKGVDHDGLVFYTNRDSRKGRELAREPRASALFPWYDVHRQVHAEGTVEPLPDADSDAYWATRPPGSQLGSAASPQSQVIDSRADLDTACAALRERHGDGPIPRPPHWGGMRLVPHTVEFWQGRADRLHDRLRYRRTDDGSWVVERLAP
jgi:pyridoxamine 5'-phosphate oxidase